MCLRGFRFNTRGKVLLYGRRSLRRPACWLSSASIRSSSRSIVRTFVSYSNCCSSYIQKIVFLNIAAAPRESAYTIRIMHSLSTSTLRLTIVLIGRRFIVIGIPTWNTARRGLSNVLEGRELFISISGLALVRIPTSTQFGTATCRCSSAGLIATSSSTSFGLARRRLRCWLWWFYLRRSRRRRNRWRRY